AAAGGQVVNVVGGAFQQVEEHALGGVGGQNAGGFDVLVHHAHVELFEDVLGAGDTFSALLDEAVGAVAHAGGDRAGHGEDVAILLEGERDGDEGAALLVCLHDQHAKGETRYDPVAR